VHDVGDAACGQHLLRTQAAVVAAGTRLADDAAVQDEDRHRSEAEPLQAVGDGALDLAREVSCGRIDVELGGNAGTLGLRDRAQPLSDHRLGDAIAVKRGRIDPVDSDRERLVEHALAHLLRAADQQPTDPAPTEGQGGDLQPGSAKASSLHGFSRVSSRGSLYRGSASHMAASCSTLAWQSPEVVKST